MKRWQMVRPGAGRRLWRWVRLAGGVLIIALVVRRLGAAPFIDGVRRVDAASVVAAMGLTAMTTVVSAWRWRLIADGLGLRIPLRNAVASYYRSQFLNSTLPGGVVGDVHRGVLHGQRADDVSRGLRSVAWDRGAGQVVQVVVAAVTLLLLASPVRPSVEVVLSIVMGAVAVIAVAAAAVRQLGLSWPARLAPLARVAHAVRTDARAVVPDPMAAVAIAAASVLVVAGHVGVFLIAARAAGATAGLSTLLPLALLVLLATTVPTSVGGWGPREGVAAWAFALAGLGATQGVETATVYGVLGLVATLPGAGVLLSSWRPLGRTQSAPQVEPEPAKSLVSAGSGRG